jgi:hypothetical protein
MNRTFMKFVVASTLLTSSPVALSGAVPEKVVDLHQTYGLDAGNGSTAVGRVCGTEAAMRSRFPAWSGHWEAQGGSMEELMGMSFLTCAWNDAVARMAPVPGEALELRIPAGRYRVDQVLYVMDGHIRGAAAGGTQLVRDATRWKQGDAMLQVWPGAAEVRQLSIADLAFVGNGTGTGKGSTAMRLVWPGGELNLQGLSATGFSGGAIEVLGADATDIRDVTLRSNGTGIALLGCTGTGHGARSIRGSGNGTWFRTGPWEGTDAQQHWYIGPVAGMAGDRPETGRLLVAQGQVEVAFADVDLRGGTGGPWITVSRMHRGSRITGERIRLGSAARPLLEDQDRKAVYPGDARDGMDFCWTPGTASRLLPATCAGDGPQRDTTVIAGGYKSGGASIVIDPVQGPALTDLQWGYNTSGLFSVSPASDTALQARLSELTPRVLRFPGGTLANFYHPSGLGYGIMADEVQMVEGTTVHDNIYKTWQAEQADIAAGEVSGNYIHEMIALAQATDESVLYVANLFTGTVYEMVAAIQEFLDAGVSVYGVELGNEAHLKAYDSRFGSVENYLAVAQPYANAIQTHFPGMKIGLDGYPPGIIKDLGPAGTQRAHDWNVACSDAAFGDALIIHCYSRPSTCTQQGVTANFNCSADFSRVYANEKLPAALSELASLGSKKIWITEWNIDGEYDHYGNSMAQALFYADMSLTMAQEPKVTVSSYHELLAFDDGYNLIRRVGNTVQPMVNYWMSMMFKELYVTGNQPQEVTISGIDGLRGYAFRATDGKQHLYLINRSGTAMDLSAYQAAATAIQYMVLGSDDIAEGTEANSARSFGDVAPANGTAASMAQVQLPPYAIAHLSWTPSANTPLWSTSFAGMDGCRLKAILGSDVMQGITDRCATIGGSQITTQAKTSFPMSVNVSKIILYGVTFSNVEVGRWINSRVRFQGPSGQLMDAGTGQVLATVSPGVYYGQLVLDFGQPVPMESLIGRMNTGIKTALMTVESMKVFP